MKYIKLFENFFSLDGKTFKRVDDFEHHYKLNPNELPSNSTIERLKSIIIDKIGSDNISNIEMFRGQLVASLEIPNDGDEKDIYDLSIDFYEDDWYIISTYEKPEDHEYDAPYDEVTYLCDQIQGVEDALTFLYG